MPGTSTHTRRPPARIAASASGPLCGTAIVLPRESAMTQEAVPLGVRGSLSSNQSAIGLYSLAKLRMMGRTRLPLF